VIAFAREHPGRALWLAVVKRWAILETLAQRLTVRSRMWPYPSA